MTKEFYRTGSYNTDHSTFRGRLYNYDFDGYTSMTDIAARIVSDWKFDNQCKKNTENKSRKGNM